MIGWKITEAHLFKLVADEGEGLVDGVSVSRDGDDALGAGAIADVDLGAALQMDFTQ